MDTGDQQFMARALELAARGRGRAEPNPMVGAVLVRAGEVIGEGFHPRCGGPHAEVAALDDCRRRGLDPAGATLYVTLEPCCHFGRTPPCTEAVLAAGVSRVVAAMIDPAVHAAGQGLRQLTDAGIELTVGIGEREAHELNAPYIKRQRTGLPWVICKWAQTLDGRIATATGDSQWISADASRQRVHELRARVDAIVVGINTVLADDPRLTARITTPSVEPHRTALRVVIDPNLRMPATAQLVEHLSPEHPPVILATRRALVDAGDPRALEWEARGVGIVGLPTRAAPDQDADGDDAPRLDLEVLLRELVDVHDATNVLVEGGGALHGALFEQGLVDQVLAFIAPRVMGDNAAIPAVHGLTCDAIANAHTLRLQHIERIDDDVLLDYRTAPD